MSFDDYADPKIDKDDLEAIRIEMIKYIDALHESVEKLENALINQAIQLDLLQNNLNKLMEKK